MHKTTVIGIISWKTTNIWLFDNPGRRIWQPFLVRSQPIFDFLEPWFQASFLVCGESVINRGKFLALPPENLQNKTFFFKNYERKTDSKLNS